MSDGNGHGGDGANLPAVRNGRPRVMTEAVQRAILRALTRGSFLGPACEAAGVSFRTFQHWRRRWRKGDPEASEYDQFYHDVKKAIALGEVAMLEKIEAAAVDTWQAAAWILERRFAKRWARYEVLEVRGANRDLSNLSD